MTTYIDIHSELIGLCRKHDSTAQFKLYKLYYKAMFNTSLRIVNQHADAEDIMQEAFLTAFSKIDSFKGEVSFGAWLKRIVVNLSLDYLRKKKKVQMVYDTEGLTLGTETPSYFCDEKDEAVVLQKVQETIPNLPDGYRIIFTLHLIEGYDHEEIAEILKITPSTSRSQLARAKKKLIEMLEISPKKQQEYERA